MGGAIEVIGVVHGIAIYVQEYMGIIHSNALTPAMHASYANRPKLPNSSTSGSLLSLPTTLLLPFALCLLDNLRQTDSALPNIFLINTDGL